MVHHFQRNCDEKSKLKFLTEQGKLNRVWLWFVVYQYSDLAKENMNRFIELGVVDR